MRAGIENEVHAVGLQRKTVEFLRSCARFVNQFFKEKSWIEEVVGTVGLRRVEFNERIIHGNG